MAESPDMSGGLVARNSVILLVARATTMVAGLASLPVLYGRLGEQAYGVWALLTGMVAVAALADMGLNSAQIREVARAANGGDQRYARSALTLGLVWTLCLGALAFLGTTVSWPWLARVFHLGVLTSPARDAMLLLLVGLMLDGLAMPWRAALEGTQRYGAIGWAIASTAVVGAVLAVLVVLLGGGLVPLAASVTATSAVRTCMLMAAAHRQVPSLVPRLRDVRRTDVPVLGAYGVRVQAANAAAAVNNEMDRLVLAGFSAPATVAGFDLGSRMANMLRMPLSFVLTSVFPVAAAAAAACDRSRLDRLYVVLTRYMAVLAGTGAAVLVVAADPLVRLWLGRPVPMAAMTIAILAPGFAVSVTAGAAAVVARAEGSPGREMRSTVLAAVLNAALTIPFLYMFGPLGVPLATTLAVSAMTCWFFASFHRSSGRPLMPLLGQLWPPAVAATVAGALVSMAGAGLPDGPDRIGAALSVGCRGGLTLLITGTVLAALEFFDTQDRARGRAAVAWLTRRQPMKPGLPSNERVG